MSKFGKKFSCWKCSTKFYDLNKPEPRCPKCGANPEDDPNRGLVVPPAAAFPEEAAEEVDETFEEEAEEEADDEEVADEAPEAEDF
jgi:hypothetical protein